MGIQQRPKAGVGGSVDGIVCPIDDLVMGSAAIRPARSGQPTGRRRDEHHAQHQPDRWDVPVSPGI